MTIYVAAKLTTLGSTLFDIANAPQATILSLPVFLRVAPLVVCSGLPSKLLSRTPSHRVRIIKG